MARPVSDHLEPLTLTGEDLTVEDVVAVARAGRRVRLDEGSNDRLAEGHQIAVRAIRSGKALYGVTTGVGALKKVRARGADLDGRARGQLQAHITPFGTALPEEIVCAAMLHRLNAFARGRSVARPEVAHAYVRALNEGFAPVVHSLGSAGPSDLSAMAEIARALMDRGLALQAGEALAMMNSNSLTVGHGALALHDTERLLDSLDVAAALSLEAFAGNVSILHPEVAQARPLPGLQRSLKRLHGLLEGSYLWNEGAARNLQDPVSFRCIPHIHGATWDAFRFVREQIEQELNSSGDNPMIARSDQLVVSTGNFDITGVAVAFDLARVALAQALTIACERVEKHLARQFSGLPTGLRVDDNQEDEALSLIDQASSALAAEARLLASPVSLEVPTTSSAEGIEDHMTMAHLGVRRLAEMNWLGARACAVELVVAAQAIDLRGNPRLGIGTGSAYRTTREHVSFVGPADSLADGLEALGKTVERAEVSIGGSVSS